MLEFTDVKISKNPCKAGEKIVICVEIRETTNYPHGYPYGYPKYRGVALPETLHEGV